MNGIAVTSSKAGNKCPAKKKKNNKHTAKKMSSRSFLQVVMMKKISRAENHHAIYSQSSL